MKVVDTITAIIFGELTIFLVAMKTGLIDFTVITLETVFLGLFGGCASVLGKKLIEKLWKK